MSKVIFTALATCIMLLAMIVLCGAIKGVWLDLIDADRAMGVLFALIAMLYLFIYMFNIIIKVSQ